MKRSLGAKTLVYPTPAWVIGSYDNSGKANAMTVAWGGICCSRPPQVTISLRKATYTYNCILERKAYTVNVMAEPYVAELDYFGIASGRDIDKFAESGLTPVRSELVDAPYVQEASLVLECKLTNTLELGLHTMFIGEILDVKADEEVLTEGTPDVAKMRPVWYAPGMQQYFGIAGVAGKGYRVGEKFRK